MKHFSAIVAWYSVDCIPGILSCSSSTSISLICILNNKIALVFETEKIELRMKNHCGEWVGFSFRLLCGFGGRWFCWREVFWDQCYNLTFLLFSLSKVMILLAFLSCFLVFFFVKDQIASFQLKQIIVFVFCVCVYFIAWLQPS